MCALLDIANRRVTGVGNSSHFGGRRGCATRTVHCQHKHTSTPVGCICSARATTRPNRLLLLLLLQNSSQAVHMPRSVLNLRTARSKMKWMRRTMEKSASVFFFSPGCRADNSTA